MRLRWITLLPFVLAGCAVNEPAAITPPAPPAARIALRPEYRVFYDALSDYGDWVLIEPWGYLFRPRVDFGVWRPYTNGFWAASDLYGWVWVSSESFGWATEHYGRWFWDDYQGWVWMPGRDWAPAWVAWQANDDWVAWAPLSPRDTPDFGPGLPGGPFVYAPLRTLGSTDVTSQVVTRDKAGEAAASLQTVQNTAVRNGVRFNLGPAIARVEKAAPPHRRSRRGRSRHPAVAARAARGGRSGGARCAALHRPDDAGPGARGRRARVRLEARKGGTSDRRRGAGRHHPALIRS
jgi:hypothetical protein